MKKQGTGIAVYTHRLLEGQVYRLGGVRDLAQAWEMFDWACKRAGWNNLVEDVKVEFKA